MNHRAGVAELAYATGLGPVGRKPLEVRVLSPAFTPLSTLGYVEVPTLADVHEARDNIAPHLRPTPLYEYASLNELVGAQVFVKHENHQPVGAFKVRGGLNLVSQLSDEERERGVIAASTGNHGQSMPRSRRAPVPRR